MRNKIGTIAAILAFVSIVLASIVMTSCSPVGYCHAMRGYQHDKAIGMAR